MVAFCMKCGASLPPTADVVIRNGKELPSPDFKCPACSQMAGETESDNSKNPKSSKPK